jgi:Tfp pilus assembly protein PilN
VTNIANLGLRVNDVLRRADAILDNASRALDLSQGDKFRIKGIFADLDELNARLTYLGRSVGFLQAGIEDVRADLRAAGGAFAIRIPIADTSIANLSALQAELARRIQRIQELENP